MDVLQIWGVIVLNLRRLCISVFFLSAVFFMSIVAKGQSLESKVEKLAKNKQFDQAMKLIQQECKKNPGAVNVINPAIKELYYPLTSLVNKARPPEPSKQEIAVASHNLEKIIYLSKLYYKLNNEVFDRTPSIYCLKFLPNPLQNQFRRYYHKWFTKKIEKLQEQYNYSSQPENSFERIQVQARFLREMSWLLPVWSCEYWHIYMAPELRKYIQDSSSYLKAHPDEYYPASIRLLLKVEGFTVGDGRFDIEAYNDYLDIIQSIFNGPALSWKLEALEKLQMINNDVNGSVDQIKWNTIKSGNPRYEYYETLSSSINASQIPGALDSTEIRRSFIKEILRCAAGAPWGLINAVDCYVKKYGERCVMNNGKVDTELFSLGAKAGIPMIRLTSAISFRDSGKLKSERDRIMKLLKSITPIPPKKVKSNSTSFLEKQARERAREEKVEISNDEQNAETKKRIKKYGIHRFFKNFDKIYCLKAKGKYKPAGYRNEILNNFWVYILRDGKDIYMPSITESGQYITLLHFDMETMKVSPVAQYNFENRYRQGDDRFAMTEKFVIHYNTKDGIDLIPKAGGKVKNVKIDFSEGQQISPACIAKGKMYFWKYLGSSNHNKSGGEVIEFDLGTHKLKKLYSSIEDSNHIFGKSICSFFPGNGWYNAVDNSLIFYIETYNCYLWKYYLDSSEWECIWRHKRGLKHPQFIKEYNVYKFSEKNKGNYLLSLEPDGKGLKTLTEEFGLGDVNQDIDISLLQFSFKKGYGFSVWPGCFTSGKKLILPKEKSYVDFESFKPRYIFMYNGKRYCITVNSSADQTNIYIGELESNRTMKMESPENSIQIINYSSEGK